MIMIAYFIVWLVFMGWLAHPRSLYLWMYCM